METRLCPDCGLPNSQTARFCRNCGESLITNVPSYRAKPVNSYVQAQESHREKITRSITYQLAALHIARSDFPKKDNLPSSEPPPFNSFGHQLLLDYKLLLRIIWQTVENIQSALDEVPKSKRTKGILWGVGTGILSLVILLIISSDATCSILSFFSAFICGFAAYSLAANIKKEQKEVVASIRADAIEKLINGDWVITNSAVEQEIQDLYLVGDGNLNGSNIPVLTVVNNQYPFPGYGRLQAENLFICRPSEDVLKEPSASSNKEIGRFISSKIIDTVSTDGQQEMSCGEVIVIRGKSIPIDSPWLDQEKVPRLYLERNRLEYVETIDPRASVRVYFAIQVIFPEYMTVATIFIRPFLACNAASCQIAVTTLGPLVEGTDYFRQRLLRHRLEKEGALEKFIQASKSKKTSKKDDTSLKFRKLRFVRTLGFVDRSFQADLNPKELKELSITDVIDYKEEREKAIEESAIWPGFLIAAKNIREANSLTFTNDFFGKTEAIASVKALYDQIARTVLDSLDELGFDISDYRDSEGHYFINADKIDQLVMGERIEITQTKEKEEAVTTEEISNQQHKGSKQ